MANFADAALPLAEGGWPVFPLGQDKKPRTIHGFKDATKDAAQIAAWSAQWPDALVGVPTGKASGVFVLDVDVKNGKDGFSTLSTRGWNLPATRTHKTRNGGGAHYLFRAPSDNLLKNSASKLGAGLDTRGDGGYIVWWPAHGGSVENDDVFADVPRCLLDALQEPAYRIPATSGEGIAEGGRNDTLFRLASSLRAKGLTEDAIGAALQVENAAKCSPPLPPDEVMRIAQSVGRYAEGETGGGDAQAFDYGGGRFEVSPRGVFFIGTDRDGNELSPRWICSPLSVVAMTRDAKSGEWGRLLEWRDDDQVRHQWAMPLELLQGDGADVRRELARLGLSIAPGKASRDLLASYLQVWPVRARARCVERLGWHGAVYVTPAESIGQADEIVVFQNTHALEPAFAVSGRAVFWGVSVVALGAVISRLVFALSVAFAGALADLVWE